MTSALAAATVLRRRLAYLVGLQEAGQTVSWDDAEIGAIKKALEALRTVQDVPARS